MKEKLKALFTDSIWSIAGLMLMNVVAQFAVYPLWNRVFGSEKYGEILYLLSLMNIIAISMGSGANYARMSERAKGETHNAPYLMMLVMASVLIVPFAYLVRRYGNTSMNHIECILFALLTCATMWRFYADVEYRIHLNYKGYFLYYLAVSAGYLVGMGLFSMTKLWPLALLPGELLGLAMVLVRGSTLRPDTAAKQEVMQVGKVIAIMFASNVVSNLVFNGDRLLLKTIIGGSAVTIYYLASLLGKTVSLVTTPLNSVIIGHLTGYSGTLSKRMLRNIVVAAAGMTILATGACTIASYILIPILYPGDYAAAKVYFVLANLAQVLYFVGNMMTVVLLRFADARYQMYVNGVYAGAFCLCCIPMTVFGELPGFCVGLVLACFLRLAICTVMCSKEAEKMEEMTNGC